MLHEFTDGGCAAPLDLMQHVVTPHPSKRKAVWYLLERRHHECDSAGACVLLTSRVNTVRPVQCQSFHMSAPDCSTNKTGGVTGTLAVLTSCCLTCWREIGRAHV